MSQSSPAITTPGAPVQTPWAKETDEVVAELGTHASDGLTSAEAKHRAELYGPNRLAAKPPIPIWKRFVDQFRSVLILLLAIGAVAAAAVGDLKDAIVIGSVLVINAILGTIQEARAENSLDALKAMLSATARVKRDGRVEDVDADQLVPGDVISLEAGDRVPADARLLVTYDGEADEAALTGESLPVTKATGTRAADAALGDRTSMLWMNTTITRGRVEAVVTATGMSTEMGRIADLLNTADDTETPLARQLDGLGKRLAGVAGVAMVLYLVVGMARGEALKDIIGSAIGLAIAAVPEGLPAVVTVTLALGVSQVAKHGAIVKNLSSVETLGSTTVICSDKTGTLTMNRMSAVELQIGGTRHEVSVANNVPSIADTTFEDRSVRDLLELSVLASDAVVTIGDGAREVGDPTEVGIVRLASQAGIDGEQLRRDRPRVAEVPFDSDRKYMVAIVDDGTPEQYRFAVKGAVDRLIGRCSAIRFEGRTVPLTQEHRDAVAATVDGAARQGRRVLAVCTTTAPQHTVQGANLDRLIELSRELELVGLVGLADPPRPEAAEAIAEAQGAGIALKMITGDHPTTATAIAEEIGIVGDTVSGAELDEWSDEQLTERVEDIGVFARVSPEHKLRIVRSLQARGNVTAMTGDGVNDAPSLKQADVGVAMGITGTEVSKEAADVVLADDQLGSIVKAVGQGRAIYDNIVTFVRFQVATNIGAILTLVGSQLIGLPKPFAAIQLLWINIIMDGPPAMALGTDKPKPGVMKRTPRKPNEPILSKNRLGIIMMHGTIMAAVTLGILAWGEREYGEAIGATMAFTVFVLFQIVNALNVRSEGTLFQRQTFTNKILWSALGLVTVLQILVVEADWMNNLFETHDLTLTQWGWCIAGALVLFVVDEVRRNITHRAGKLD